MLTANYKSGELKDSDDALPIRNSRSGLLPECGGRMPIRNFSRGAPPECGSYGAIQNTGNGVFPGCGECGVSASGMSRGSRREKDFSEPWEKSASGKSAGADKILLKVRQTISAD